MDWKKSKLSHKKNDTPADKEHISKEIEDIQNAIAAGIPTYELKYSVKVERHGLRMQIVSD